MFNFSNNLEFIKMRDALAPRPQIWLVSLRVHCCYWTFWKGQVWSKMTNLRNKNESTTTKRHKVFLWTIEPS